MSTEPQRLRVLTDSDVVIAGAASVTGASHLVLQLSELGLIEAVASEQIRQEVERNLENKLPQALPHFRLLADAALLWVPDPRPRDLRSFPGQADAKDLPVLAAAVRAGCHSLLTFNVKDYKPQEGSVRIETPGAFIERLREHLSGLASS